MSVPAPASLRERIYAYDFMRFVAIILVVIVHVSAQIKDTYYGNPFNWWTGNIYDSLARVCVPLFVMVSGALLLAPGRAESLATFFSKRFKKVLIPFIVWTLVYILWQATFSHGHFTFTLLLTQIVEGQVIYHLWFLYMLMGLYLVTPLLRALIKGADRQLLYYFLILWFVLTSLASIFTGLTHISLGYGLVVMGGYVGYYLLGYVLTQPINPIRRLWPWALLAAAGLLVTIFGSYALTRADQGSNQSMFLDYLSPNIVVMAVFVFELIRRQTFPALQRGRSLGARLVLTLSSTSFSIYLMHIIVLEVLARGVAGFKLSALTFHPYIGIPLTTLVTLAICVPLILLARKVPLLRPIFQ